MIPSQLGHLEGASVLLKTNDFDDKTAPLSLCMLLSVNEFDLVNETAFCPLERNALSDFYDSAKVESGRMEPTGRMSMQASATGRGLLATTERIM